MREYGAMVEDYCQRKTEGFRETNTYLSATLSTTNPAWTDLGMNLGLYHEKPVTDHLSYGTAHLLWFMFEYYAVITFRRIV
jgi:hypothetical protein